jgi:4-carboxymuconolactone decarboxylase
MTEKKPGFYEFFKKQYPDVIDAVETVGEAARKAGPLDAKTLHFAQLAASAAVRSEGAVHSHTRRALEAGATPEEIRHAIISLISTIGFPNVTAALSWVEDVLSKSKPRSS